MCIVSNSNRMQDKCPHNNDHIPKNHWNKSKWHSSSATILKRQAQGTLIQCRRRWKVVPRRCYVSQLPQHIFSLISCNLPITIFYTTAGMFVSHGEIMPWFCPTLPLYRRSELPYPCQGMKFCKNFFFKKMDFLMSFGHVLMLQNKFLVEQDILQVLPSNKSLESRDLLPLWS